MNDLIWLGRFWFGYRLWFFYNIKIKSNFYKYFPNFHIVNIDFVCEFVWEFDFPKRNLEIRIWNWEKSGKPFSTPKSEFRQVRAQLSQNLYVNKNFPNTCSIFKYDVNNFTIKILMIFLKTIIYNFAIIYYCMNPINGDLRNNRVIIVFWRNKISIIDFQITRK